MTEQPRTDLTDSIKRALVIILEDGEVTKVTHGWRGSSGRSIFTRTVFALYERYLVKIVVENHHRRRQMAKLTDVGEYAARMIKLDLEAGAGRKLPISLEGSLMVTGSIE